MTPRLACADFTFPLLPHDKSLDLIAMLGFEGVDIGLFRRAVAPLALARVRRPEGVGARAGGQAPRPRAHARRSLPSDCPGLRLARPQPSGCLDPSPGARLV